MQIAWKRWRLDLQHECFPRRQRVTGGSTDHDSRVIGTRKRLVEGEQSFTLRPWPYNDSHIGAFGGRTHNRKVFIFSDETNDRSPTAPIDGLNMRAF
jgi:hypothetical protein